MRLSQLVKLIESAKGFGMTLDAIKKNASDVPEEDIKRLLSSGVDLGEIKKDGQGRGVKYYGIDVEVVQRSVVAPKVNDAHLIDGAINVGQCKNTKEKVAVVLESDHSLSQPITLSYRERLLENASNRELRDFLNDGVVDVDVKIHYDLTKKKNIVYSKHAKTKYNKIMIGKEDGKLFILKMFNGSIDNPEKKEFHNWQEFEKYLRTLLCK